LDYIDYVRRKVSSVFAQIHAIECADFPYSDPKRALAALRSALDVRLEELDNAVTEGDLTEITNICKNINYKIVELHSILGFLLRATNIRTQFEIFEPIRELAHMLLDYTPGVILSSEWEFSPFTFPFVSEDLNDFVFIGLPASEASSALVLPLAGHELGHSIWRRGGVRADSAATINNAVVNRFMMDKAQVAGVFGNFDAYEDLLDNQNVLSMLSMAYDMTTRQCEESFCDALGVRLFGESFLHSFEYLLVPSLGGGRSEFYPPLAQRLSDMKDAAKLFGYALRYQHSPPILETDISLQNPEKFALLVADDAARSLIHLILKKAQLYCDEKRVPVVDKEVVEVIVEDFAKIIPGQNTVYLGNIVDAGWLVYKEFQNFVPEVGNRDRVYDILNNLVFKSLEVLEYERKA
jgi:hypothetical protein